MTWTPYASAIIPSSSQEERSTWCAGTRTGPRRREPTLSRRREIKYSLTHPSKHYFFFKTNNCGTACYSEFVYCRKFMSTSLTCQRPRKSGSSPRASRESTRPSMCWWVTFYVADIYQNIVQFLQPLRYCLNPILCHYFHIIGYT